MPEQEPQDSKAITWVKQHSTALWTTVGAGLLAILMPLLRGSVSPDLLLTTLLATLTLVIVGVWTFAAAASRQRTKISKLEARIRNLERENSSYRNPPPISDADDLSDIEEKILMSLTGKKQLSGDSISKIIGRGVDATHVHLSDLSKKKFVFHQIVFGAAGYWYLGLAGKRYLVDRDLI